jgi:RNA polymerase-binding transcription factor DksA
MDSQFLARQKERIRRRIDRYEGLSRDPNHERAAYADHKHKNILPRLREALYRMEKGTYGVCARCGGTIPRERLAIIPGALTCTTCHPHPQNKPNQNLNRLYYAALMTHLSSTGLRKRLTAREPVTRDELFGAWRQTIAGLMWNASERAAFSALPRSDQETYFPDTSLLSFDQLCKNVSERLRFGGGTH